jgi:hypothetical protein
MDNTSYRSRNILVGVVVVIILILIAIFVIRRSQEAANLLKVNTHLPTPVSQFQQSLQDNFGITVPPTAIKSDLKDVSGGSQMGLATVDKQNSQNTYTVIANLEDPTSGYFYEAWLVNGTDTIPLGKLNVAKGGWLINYSSSKDVSDHKTVWITLEKVDDNTPEKHILEGSF